MDHCICYHTLSIASGIPIFIQNGCIIHIARTCHLLLCQQLVKLLTRDAQLRATIILDTDDYIMMTAQQPQQTKQKKEKDQRRVLSASSLPNGSFVRNLHVLTLSTPLSSTADGFGSWKISDLNYVVDNRDLDHHSGLRLIAESQPIHEAVRQRLQHRISNKNNKQQ